MEEWDFLETKNLSQYLSLYNKVYPRYKIADFVTWQENGEGFLKFQSIILSLFNHSTYLLGIPVAFLNLFVFVTVILIIKYPFLGFDTFSDDHFIVLIYPTGNCKYNFKNETFKQGNDYPSFEHENLFHGKLRKS